MTNPTTIVIPVWNKWDLTRDCLETLRPTLGQRDQVVVVNNGSVDGTASGLRRYPWVEVVTNETNRGFAAACNQGAAVARHDVVVFLNNDTLLPSRWLDGLLEPFADPMVGATGPRSNFVSGPQLVTVVGYAPGDVSGLRRWARVWREEHRGQRTEVLRLVGFCFAVRRSAFEEIGGFDEQFEIGGFEDDDLCRRLSANGYQLLIAHDSFVHHHGHQTFLANGLDWLAIQDQNQTRFEGKHAEAFGRSKPLLSACLIVRDEEERLPACLASLDRVVDEVVVYDTGSTDQTIKVAADAGARVIQGSWNDDFGEARNIALGHCLGTWVMSIDADEVLHCDPAMLRKVIEHDRATDALMIEIVNLSGDRANPREGLTHHAFRLLRKATMHWQGRLHEQPVGLDPSRQVRRGEIPGVRLVHYGYLQDEIERLQKRERNIRLAELDAADNAVPEDIRLCNLGRSLMWGGRVAEGLERFTEVRRVATNDIPHRTALCFGVEALLLLDRTDEAREWIDELKSLSEPGTAMVAFLEGLLGLRRGDGDGALQAFDRITGRVELDGVAYEDIIVQARRGLALAVAGRWEDAVTALLPVARSSDQPVWSALIGAQWARRGDLSAIAAAISDDQQLLSAVAQGAANDDDIYDAWLETLWVGRPGHHAILAGVAALNGPLPVGRALEWSARLRSAGAPSRCPLTALVSSPRATPVDRIRAAAVLLRAFGEAAPAAFDVAASLVDPAAFHALLIEVDQISPQLLPRLVSALATSPARCLDLSRVLIELGAPDEAGVILERGFGHRDAEQAAASLNDSAAASPACPQPA